MSQDIPTAPETVHDPLSLDSLATESRHRIFRPSVRVPDYRWLNVVAVGFQIMAGITLIVGCFMSAAFIWGNTAASIFYGVLVAMGALWSALVSMAIGQGILAFRDIARNSWITAAK